MSVLDGGLCPLDQDEPESSAEFGCYSARRVGWRWQVYCNGSDDLSRPTYTGKFWRRITAERIAQALWLAYMDGIRYEDDRPIGTSQ